MLSSFSAAEPGATSPRALITGSSGSGTDPLIPRTSSIGWGGALRDQRAGLWLMRHRWYDDTQGRFITRDPAGYVDGLSMYLYARGNPIIYYDPYGLQCVKDLEKEHGLQRGTDANEPLVLTPDEIKKGEEWERNFNKEMREKGKELAMAYGTGILGAAMIVSPVDEIMIGTIAAKYGAKAAQSLLKAAAKAVRAGKSSDEVTKAVKAAADKVVESQKKVPNPGGRHGGPAHRQTVADRAKELEEQGHTITGGGGGAEKMVKTSDGVKRYPDISTRGPDGKPYHENVGRTNKDGTPVARERRALEDIERATGTKPGFTPTREPNQ